MISSIKIRATVRHFLICLLASTALFISSCVKKPVFVKIDSVKTGSLQDSLLKALITFKIYNPNGVGCTLAGSKLMTYYRGKLVGDGQLDKELAIPAKDTAYIPMVSNIHIWKLAEVFPKLLTSDSSVFRINGETQVKVLGIKFTVPTQEDVTLNVRAAVLEMVGKTFQSDSNFKVKDVRMSKLPGIEKSRFSLVVSLKNGFSFNYRLVHLNLNVYRKNGNEALANWKLADSIDQKTGAESDIPISVEVDNLKVLRETRLSDLLHPNLEFVLKGEAQVSIQGHLFTIPINEEKKIKISPLSGITF